MGDVVALSSGSRLAVSRTFSTGPFEFVALRLRSWRVHRALLRVAGAIILLLLTVSELRSSRVQSWIFTAISHRMTLAVLPGGSESLARLPLLS